MCGIDTVNGTWGMEWRVGNELTGSEFSLGYNKFSFSSWVQHTRREAKQSALSRAEDNEPHPRGSARSPSSCGSNLVDFFFSFPSPLRGCRPRFGCRGWMEMVGGDLYVLSWKAGSVQASTCLFTRSETNNQQQHREEVPARPEETESPNSCSPHTGPVFGRDLSF